MKNMSLKTGLFILVTLFLTVSCSKNNEEVIPLNQNNQSVEKKATINPSVNVFVPEIVNPRGLEFGPDGYLYVALAGIGGEMTTNCTQVVSPVGPYSGGYTSSIVKISPTGEVSTVVSELPSEADGLGSTIGVADIAFVGDQLYALLNAGCSHGIADTPASVIKVDNNGKWSVVANISAYLADHPVAAPEKDDFEPDGTPYSMVNVRGDLYVIEPNHGEMMKVTTSGKITRVIDFSAHFGHIVPTSVAYHGNFFVGNLTPFPLVGGSASIYKVTPSGEVKVWSTGFTGVLGVAFDQQNRMYVLETSAGDGPIPFTGRVVLVNSNNTRQVIVDGLNFPTAMTFGPDGALYISNAGFGFPTGQILKVVL